MDSPPTALGNSGYQSAGDLLEVKISDRPGRPARHRGRRPGPGQPGVGRRCRNQAQQRIAPGEGPSLAGQAPAVLARITTQSPQVL
jgi:hypothetical protein